VSTRIEALLDLIEMRKKNDWTFFGYWYRFYFNKMCSYWWK
jgi:hypothetical protein